MALDDFGRMESLRQHKHTNTYVRAKHTVWIPLREFTLFAIIVIIVKLNKTSARAYWLD